MNEPYRTLLGHFRHETGHFTWNKLVRDGGRLGGFRAVFGDEREDYAAALQAQLRAGATARTGSSPLSAPTPASHPWEDFAECFAHYLHIVDTLETARSFRHRDRSTRPRGNGSRKSISILTGPSAEQLVNAWVPLSGCSQQPSAQHGAAELLPLRPRRRLVVIKLEFMHRADPGGLAVGAATSAA